VRLFAANENVSFFDVNLAEHHIREGNPGAGGWPSIRYFRKETGMEPQVYEKKTSKPICDELGEDDMMIAYVEEYGNTSLCSLDGKGCNERELSFIEKMKGVHLSELETQIARLGRMEGESMKDDLKKWIRQRQKILEKLVADQQMEEL
jgi:hypothetical protein